MLAVVAFITFWVVMIGQAVMQDIFDPLHPKQKKKQ
jgi:hypothetical protein